MDSIYQALGATLIDGVARNSRHPDTFEIPTDEEKLAIKKGDFVKIGLESSEGGERFWTIVQSVEGDVITASVDNFLMNFDLDLGQELQFGYEHVLSIIDADEE